MEIKSYYNNNYRYNSRSRNAARPNNVVSNKVVKDASMISTETLTDLIDTVSTANYNQGYIKGYIKGVAGFAMFGAAMGLCGYFIGMWVENKSSKKRLTEEEETRWHEVKEEESNGDKEL